MSSDQQRTYNQSNPPKTTNTPFQISISKSLPIHSPKNLSALIPSHPCPTASKFPLSSNPFLPHLQLLIYISLYSYISRIYYCGERLKADLMRSEFYCWLEIRERGTKRYCMGGDWGKDEMRWDWGQVWGDARLGDGRL